MNLGSRIKTLRTERGWIQKDLAERLNVSKQVISAYENGQRRPDLDTLQRMAEIFGVTSDYLLGQSISQDSSGEDLEVLFPEGVRVLRRASKKLTPEQKQKMANLMEWFLQQETKE